MRRTKEEAAETKEKIVAAAIRAFSEKGFAAASLGDIAQAAGVSRGAIYWHFANKEALFEELLQRLDSYHLHLVESGRTQEIGEREAFRSILTQLIRRQVDDPEWQMMQEIIVRDFLNRRGNVPWMDTNSRGDIEGERFFDEMISAGRITGFSDGKTALIAVSCFVAGWIVQSVELKGEVSEHQIRELVEFVVRGFFGNEQGEVER